ncbi:hypothetical protein MVI27_09285 [Chryseobacterium salipaludis]|uniref:hypothetical protein n=1 Tax=Chryseobacterium TaxID=59732 RepID=UPI001FF491F7|nr:MULTISPECIES: hypothetical protein [Chryseobacterium]MCJ8498453.1 hypothetical protein [Chryseobacterium salipaludis]MCX3297222.1 hypothetical protein [Planobacterium sp. JC490]
MKKLFKIYLLLLTGWALWSCDFLSSRFDLEKEKQAQENYQSPYMGKWTGTYTGDGAGTLVFNVFKSGNVEVTRTAGGSTDLFYVKVGDGGAIYNTPSPNSGFILYGNLAQKTGTWKMGDWTGSWSVTKR